MPHWQRGGAIDFNALIRMMGKEEDPENRPGFPGEFHAVMLDGAKKGYKAHFMGPGTKVKERLARGDTGITDTDNVAMRHDIAYLKASQLPKPERQAAVVQADKDFLRDIVRTKDNPLTAKISEKAIALKMIGEKLGILDPSVFSGGAMIGELRNHLPPAFLLTQEVKRGRQWGGFLPFVIPALIALAKALALGGATALGAAGADALIKKIKGGSYKQAMESLVTMPHTKLIDTLYNVLQSNPSILAAYDK